MYPLIEKYNVIVKSISDHINTVKSCFAYASTYLLNKGHSSTLYLLINLGYICIM